MRITRRSLYSGEESTRDIPVTDEQLARWQWGHGELIQTCMPDLTADDREFLLTGVTPEEWDEMFSEEVSA